MPPALIFDLDGVVIDSMPMHTDAWRIYLKRLNKPIENLEVRMHGRRNDEIVVEFIGRELSPGEIFDHGAAKERLFREMIGPRLEEHIVPGIKDFLRKHQGAAMAVASNAEPANIDFVLDAAGLRGCFRAIVDGHQVARPKPWPDIYLRAAQLLEMPPESCIVFEDSPAGVAAARAAGMRVVGVGTHTMDLDRVDLIVRDFLDPGLEKWLQATSC
ncbi:MAG TPA: HAD-IA family hydrolase [Bryobacteraceae bacterium]|nr:HAD-IA family hydrolase [Bryobacteraceae bacterium]